MNIRANSRKIENIFFLGSRHFILYYEWLYSSSISLRQFPITSSDCSSETPAFTESPIQNCTMAQYYAELLAVKVEQKGKLSTTWRQ